MAFNRETGSTKKKKDESAADVLKKTGEALTSLVEKAAEAKLTIITGSQVCGTVEVQVIENGEKTVYTLPVGVELTVSETVAQAAMREYLCQVGYFVGSETQVGALPVAGLADGSYCFVMNTGKVLFLSDGAWR